MSINRFQKIKKLTQEEVWQILPKLPIAIQDIIYDPQTSKVNGKIREEFKLNEEQFQKLLNILLLVYTREIALIDLVGILSVELNLKDQEAKNMTLELAQKHFWLMSYYIGGVEKLIKSLGGEMPKKIIKPINEQKTAQKTAPQGYEINKDQKTENIIQQNIKAILGENSEAQEQLLTSQNILLTNSGEIHKSSIKYWLMEYIQTLGAGYHSNLDRIGFLYNNPNAKKLSDEERQILGAVLKSYDDGDTLPFSETTGRLLIEKLK